MKLATQLLEETISYVGPRPDTRELCAPSPESWTHQFCDLTQFASGEKSSGKIKVCIATEDIVGPIRNGGIGTTYSLLSRLLSSEGFEVTILYLRGDYVENETIEHWVDHYRAFGVEFLPVPDYLGDRVKNAESHRWISPMYNMYQYLKKRHFDIVHVSEWRGSGYLSLLAKNIGLGLSSTNFVVKCSSPWLWNRLYGNHTTRNPVDVLKMFCEKRSVELGDHIVGGSAHLLRWMLSQGYNVDPDKTFVQPNVVVVDDLKRLANQRTSRTGDRLDINEIVFFGRLESRKGLHIFCDAIDRLSGSGTELPTISFMGKPGARIETHPHLSVVEYIEERAKGWNCDIHIHSSFQQEQAIGYLLSENRLAVMPSLIENSSLAVYEAVICGVPFVASNSGGTPELVDEIYHEDSLCDPHPVPLAKKLEKALSKGGVIAACTFSNDKNNETWVSYHRALATRPLMDTVAPAKDTLSLDVIVYYDGDMDGLTSTLESLAINRPSACNVVVVDDVSYNPDLGIARSASATALLEKYNCCLINTEGYDRGIAYNIALKACSSDAVAFLKSSDLISADFYSTLTGAIQHQPNALFTSFIDKFRQSDSGRTFEETEVPVIGDLATMFYQVNTDDLFVIGRRGVFEQLGGFTGDYGTGGEIVEYLNAAAMNNVETITVPEILLQRKVLENHQRAGIPGRVIRPFHKYGPQAFRNIFLVAKGQADRITQLESKLDKLRTERDRIRDQRKKLTQKNQELKDELRFGRVEKSNESAVKATVEEALNSIRYGEQLDKTSNANRQSLNSVLRAFADSDSNKAINKVYKENVEKLFVYANENEIAGRYINNLCPTEQHKLFLFQGDLKIDECETLPATVQPAMPGEHNDANFIFDISQLDDSERLSAPFSVFDLAGKGVFNFSYTDNHYNKVEGAIDGFNIESGYVRGWMWNQAEPGEHLYIDVYWDGKYIRSADADVFQEFRKKTMHNAAICDHGISFQLPKALIDGNRHALTLKIHRSGVVPDRCHAIVDTKLGKFERVCPDVLIEQYTQTA